MAEPSGHEDGGEAGGSFRGKSGNCIILLLLPASSSATTVLDCSVLCLAFGRRVGGAGAVFPLLVSLCGGICDLGPCPFFLGGVCPGLLPGKQDSPCRIAGLQRSCSLAFSHPDLRALFLHVAGPVVFFLLSWGACAFACPAQLARCAYFVSLPCFFSHSSAHPSGVLGLFSAQFCGTGLCPVLGAFPSFPASSYFLDCIDTYRYVDLDINI